MSDIASAVWNFVNYLVSGQWLKPAVDWIKNGIDYFLNGVYYWFRQIYKFLYNALVGFWNWILGGLEWIYNVIRPHLVNLLTVWFSFFGIKRMIFSETMSLRNKIIGIIATPFLSWFGSMILASFLPVEIHLPRASYLHEDIILDVRDFHDQVIDEKVGIYSRLFEEYSHNQIVDESVYIGLRVVGVSESSLHSQIMDESVVMFRGTLTVSEDSLHTQVMDEAVVMMVVVAISEDYLHDQVVDEVVVIQ
jgi:hypothetical protein